MEDDYHEHSNEGTESPQETETPQETEEWDLYTYQLKYVEDDGTAVTKLLEATHIHTDDDHVEIWDGDILLLMIQRMSVRNIRNVSELDMGQ